MPGFARDKAVRAQMTQKGMITMSSLKYWLWLCSPDELPARKALALVQAMGSPENVYFAGPGDYDHIGALTAQEKSYLGDKSLERADNILRRCAADNIRIVTIGDAEYPERLKNIYDPPCVLYALGRLPLFDETAALGVVGTRKATLYGKEITERLCFQMAAAGMLIVSGLAEGIDASAHTGALRAGCASVAVLGGGVDVIYPHRNRELYMQIARQGCLLSEYPPGTPTAGRHFPVRNRIISGLSLGVLVTEAPQRSGALITAAAAREQGRDVFAIPGNVGSPNSQGCNELLRDGAAIVTGSLDIIGQYMPLFPDKVSLTRRGSTGPAAGYEAADSSFHAPETAVGMDLSELRDKIKDFTDCRRAIIVTIAEGSSHIDQIVEKTGLAVSQVLSELTMMEMEGLVRQSQGKRFEITLH